MRASPAPPAAGRHLPPLHCRPPSPYPAPPATAAEGRHFPPLRRRPPPPFTAPSAAASQPIPRGHAARRPLCRRPASSFPCAAAPPSASLLSDARRQFKLARASSSFGTSQAKLPFLLVLFIKPSQAKPLTSPTNSLAFFFGKIIYLYVWFATNMKKCSVTVKKLLE